MSRERARGARRRIGPRPSSWLGLVACLGLLACGGRRAEAADVVGDAIAAIGCTGPMAAGSTDARRACDQLVARGPEVLPRLLSAMDATNVVAANWYRAAYERIVARALAAPSATFPRDEIEAYVRDARHQGRARRLALRLVDRIDPAFGAALLPGLVDDPEFRDDAIVLALARGDESKSHGARADALRAYQTAFRHARKPDQVTAAAAKLEALGQKVNIGEHLGLVTEWYLIGPYPAPGTSGFAATFPPEKSVDLSSVVAIPVEAAPPSAAKNDAPPSAAKDAQRWIPYHSTDPLGTVDLITALGQATEAVGYAYAELDAPARREAQLRCSADDNLTVWLNGRKVFGREMWLNGTRLDRFVAPVSLPAGRNRVLVKICQGPHHRDPSVGNAWTFQLRFCTADGAGLGLKSLQPPDRATHAPRPQGAKP